MLMRRDSFIGASHAARLQRKYSTFAIYYILGVGLVTALVLQKVLDPGLSLIIGMVVSGVFFYHIGTETFLQITNLINAILIGIIFFTVVLSQNEVNGFVVFFTAIGAWILLYALMWFSNNYFRYLIGFTEKEEDFLYQDETADSSSKTIKLINTQANDSGTTYEAPLKEHNTSIRGGGMTIRDRARMWLVNNLSDESTINMRVSKHFPEKDIWFFTFPSKYLQSNQTGHVRILLQKPNTPDDFIFVKVPFYFFAENKNKFDIRKSGEKFDLHISSKRRNWLEDERSDGVSFRVFEVII